MKINKIFLYIIMKVFDYIIFHKGCIDGFSSFLVLNKTSFIHDHAIIYQDKPSASNPPQNIDGKNIIIMDVAYKYEVLKEIVERAKYVLFIDHHNTIHENVVRIQKNVSNLETVYDENECGSSLVWKYFFPKKKIPLFLEYVRDNDIGTWKLYGTHSFIAGLEADYNISLSPDQLYHWNKLFDRKVVKRLELKGRTYMEYIESLLKSNSKRYSLEAFPSEMIYEEFSSYFDKPGQYKVAVVCGVGCPSTSLLGKRMADVINCDFVLFWSLHLDTKDYVLSFRSKEVDVGLIAQIFGGGGHKLASACSFPMSKHHISDLFFAQSLPRQTKM